MQNEVNLTHYAGEKLLEGVRLFGRKSDLARKLAISRNQLDRILKNKNITLKTLVRIALALNLKIKMELV